jgi:hypothetical protein
LTDDIIERQVERLSLTQMARWYRRTMVCGQKSLSLEEINEEKSNDDHPS